MNLFSPSLLAFRHHLGRSSGKEWFRHIVIALFVLAFSVLVFWAIHWGLQYIYQFGPFGKILLGKLLSMIFLFLMLLLFFSNLITSLSSFYLAHDLDLLVSLPLAKPRLFFARFIEALVSSSWMIYLFGLILFLDFGLVLKAPQAYFFLSPVILALFMVIPGLIATLFSLCLVSIFPARSTRDILFFLAILFSIALYLFVRFLRPEQLVNPDQFSNVIQYFAAVKAPDSLFLPSHWAAEITKGLWQQPFSLDWLWPALLLSTIAAFYTIDVWFFEWLYLEGFSKTQEARQRKILPEGQFENVLLKIFYASPRGILRALFLKDMRLFFRDTLRWSQLLMILALIIVYIYNFRVLDLRQIPIQPEKLEYWLTILNMAMASFVLSALGARFLFPAVSLEGRSFWILRISPVSVSQFLWSKFWLALPVVLALALLLIGVTNFLLNISAFLNVLSILTIICVSVTLTALATGMGAIYPQFKFENIAQVTTGFGAIVYMIISVTLITALVALASLFGHLWISTATKGLPFTTIQICLIISLGSAFFALGVAGTFLPMRLGIRHLEEMEI